MTRAVSYDLVKCSLRVPVGKGAEAAEALRRAAQAIEGAEAVEVRTLFDIGRPL